MLWHALLQKGWLETRYKVLFMLGIVVFFMVSAHSSRVKAPAGVRALVGSGWILVAAIAIFLAGAGIATQPAAVAAKGIHGSMHFTLSLPVGRLRLLAVRSSLGWLEMSAGIGVMCGGMWFLFPALRATTTAVEMLEYTAALVACASGLYSITVLLATFLDDIWRMWGSQIAFAALWLLFNKTPLPASANIFRAMSDGSPLVAHTMPWTAIGVSLGLSAILFIAALKIARAREY